MQDINGNRDPVPSANACQEAVCQKSLLNSKVTGKLANGDTSGDVRTLCKSVSALTCHAPSAAFADYETNPPQLSEILEAGVDGAEGRDEAVVDSETMSQPAASPTTNSTGRTSPPGTPDVDSDARLACYEAIKRLMLSPVVGLTVAREGWSGRSPWVVGVKRSRGRPLRPGVEDSRSFPRATSRLSV